MPLPENRSGNGQSRCDLELSVFGRVSLIRQSVVKILQFVAQQLDRIIVRNQVLPN